ncbi:MAG: nif-specific transcriptional activator NifA [Steroidobacteraceae bacterium]
MVKAKRHGVERSVKGIRRSDISLVGVYEISKLLTVPARLEATLAGVLQLLASFLEMRHGLIALLGEDGAPEVVVGSGWSEATAKRYFDRLPERAIGRIVVTKMPLVIERMRQDPLFENWDFSEWGASDGDSSFIGVPIKDRGNVIGTLTIDREHGDVPYFSFDEDVRFLTMIANLLGQTVRLQRLIMRDRERLMGEQRRLEKTIEHTAPAPERTPPQPGGIIGATPVIRAVLDKVRRVARSHSPVLLRGESGTGKEMFAKALHDMSPRRKGPFVAVNCAALAESVLESELFGHEKGAFTGAVAQRKGRFELADQGTLFLDEIGEISPAFQAKLLRVLQLGEFERVGGTGTIKVNVRLVAATNRNLEEAVAKGEFRADLYYRVNVVPIFLPPLRERKGDIPVLAREFLDRFNMEHDANFTWTDSALTVLTSCYFPGNVRELENCVRRTATLAHGQRIVADDFACRHDECLSAVLWKKSAESASDYISVPVGRGTLGGKSVVAASAPRGRSSDDHVMTSAEEEHDSAPTSAYLETGTTDTDLDNEMGGDAERARLVEAMETAGWVQAKAARLLGLTARQIGYALRKHHIPVKKF